MSSKGGDSESGGDAVGSTGGASGYRVAHERKARRVQMASILLRLIAAPLLLVAMVLMATDKQTVRFVIPITPVPLVFAKSAKFTGVKALVFYVIMNGIVAGYLLLRALYSLITFKSLNTNRFVLWLTFVLDQMLVYVLLAAAAATAEVAYIAKKGNTTAGWELICNLFGKFCNKVGASALFCFLGIVVLTIISMLSAHQLFSSNKGATHRRPGAKGATTPMTPKSYGRN